MNKECPNCQETLKWDALFQACYACGHGMQRVKNWERKERADNIGLWCLGIIVVLFASPLLVPLSVAWAILYGAGNLLFNRGGK